MSFECCIPCKAPKRYPGCHDHCPEYAAAREKYEQEKTVVNKKKAIEQGIDAQKISGVKRALRRKGGK